MSWCDYHRADVVGCGAVEAVAHARRVVWSCAIGGVDVDVKLDLQGVEQVALTLLGARLSPGTSQSVDLSLVPRDAIAVVTRARAIGDVEVTVFGESKAPITTELDFQGARTTLRVSACEPGTSLVEARSAVAAQLDLAARLQLWTSLDASTDIVARVLNARCDDLAVGVDGPGYRLRAHSFTNGRPRSFEIVGTTPFTGEWTKLWADGPRSIHVALRGPAAIAGAAELWSLAGDEAQLIEGFAELAGEPSVDTFVDVMPETSCVIAWWCGFDDHGPAYHGVRLALNGRYGDGCVVEPTPGRHDLVVLVDGKRSDGDELASKIGRRSALALVRDGSGL